MGTINIRTLDTRTSLKVILNLSLLIFKIPKESGLSCKKEMLTYFELTMMTHKID